MTKGKVSIEDGILYFDAYTVDEDGAESVDRFAIRKDKTQGEVNEDYYEPDEEDSSSSGGILSFFAKVKEIFLKVITVMKNLMKIIFSK